MRAMPQVSLRIGDTRWWGQPPHAPDGLIEAIEREGDTVGVQWHPEPLEPRDALALFREFVDAAR